MALDLSPLSRLTIWDGKAQNDKQELNTILQNGFIVTDEKTPFDSQESKTPINALKMASEGLNTEVQTDTSRQAANAAESKYKPFMSNDGRNYRAMYRQACNLHQRHKEVIDSLEYWQAVKTDIDSVSKKYQQGQDTFINGLLLTVLQELQNEALRDKIAAEGIPARQAYKAGSEVKVYCYSMDQVKKLKILLQAGQVELIGKVIFFQQKGAIYLNYRLLADEETLLIPIPKGLPLLIDKSKVKIE